MKILFVCFVFGLGTAGVLGRRCVVYSAGETIPAIPKGARYRRTCHSVLFDPKRYCIEWDCPTTDCSNPIIPYSGCPYCQGLGTAGGQSKGCVIYKADETIPSIPKGARYGRTCHSVINDTNKYCVNVEWDCPKTDCSDPIKPNGGCPYCRDTCVDGGKVYQKGASWKCGCNSCTCRPPIMSTMMICYDQTPPQECMATIG